MEKPTSSKIIPTIVFILFLIPIIASSLLDLEKRRENEIILKKILVEQQALKDAEEKVYLLGKFDPSKREDFAPVPAEYGISGYQMYLRNETLGAFLEMASTAQKNGIDLKIASATRNFDYQKNLWNNKWSGVTITDGKNLSKSDPDELERFKKILEYSATPGTSRHHWGTDIDINNANPEYFKTEEGEKVYTWLVQNAPLFGFCQTYTLKGTSRPTGYSEEKWHWSYLPLSRNFTQEYKRLITDTDINGFSGDQYVSSLNLINDYVLGINPDCL